MLKVFFVIFTAFAVIAPISAAINSVNHTCELDSDCDSNWTCINKICKIPCDRKFHGLCGANALCHTQGPSLICTCPDGYDGNAFVSCLPTNETKTENLCNSLSCGGNSKCDIINGKPSCFCLPDYHGSPPNCYQKNSTLLNTSSTCSINADCPLNEACIGNRCRDPCNDSICGINSECQIKNQVVSCKCRPNYTGNPFVECIEMSKPTVATTECQINSDCSPSTACINRKCVDPCFKACGREAICNVSNSLPVCSCPSNFSGDPYLECQPLETNKTTNSMCDEHTCGPNSQCNVGNGTITCSCLPGFSGNAPHCKEGCQLNSECASQLVCINRKCKDPCTIGICGLNTDCHVVNYTAVCECRKHYSGDPFIECFAISSKNQTESHNVCDAMPCGVNAVCHEKNGIVSCECMADYYGDPIEGCQPECTTNSDCPSTSACVKNKCQNPCSSACAENAKCIVLNHSPACTCAIGFTGDAKHNCTLIQAEQNLGPLETVPVTSCKSLCGKNAECMEGSCKCLLGFEGDPNVSCRAECIYHDDCSSIEACHRKKCIDPCAGSEICASNENCTVKHHVASCH